MLQENYLFKVRVICMTFNHERYILDAMNSFVMQQTNFPFVCTIVDDASTDETPSIIKHFLEEHFDLADNVIVRQEETKDYVLSYARHKTNLNCFFAVYFLKYNHYSIKKSRAPYYQEFTDTRYVAVNEGDDYWVDPLKLQKQYDLMEAHLEFSMCFHANYELLPNGEKIVHRPTVNKSSYTPEDAILGGGGFMATNSMFNRSEYLRREQLPDFWRNCPIGDLPSMLYFASKGNLGYIDDVMSVYRIQAQGSWTSKQKTLSIRTKHLKAIQRMFDEFDKYTNFQYHDAVVRKKRYNKKVHRMDVLLTILSKIKKIFQIAK